MLFISLYLSLYLSLFLLLLLLLLLLLFFSEYDKERKLVKLLEDIMTKKENKTIIFTETKRKADELTRALRRDG